MNDNHNNNNNNNNHRVLGDPFLRTFYTAYNVADKTVGLAQATNSRTSSECAADASLSSVSANADGGGDDPGGPSAAGTGSGAGSSSSDANDGLGGEETSTIAIGVAAGLVTMGLISCGVVVYAVRQRLNKAGGAYRPAVDDIDGGGGGGFEMSSGGKGSSSMAARHGGDIEREGDFLQASPRTGVRGGTGAVFGRLLGGAPQRAGFAAFDNAD